MTDELLNAAILLRRGSWVDPELFERAEKRMAELERENAALRSSRERRGGKTAKHDLAMFCDYMKFGRDSYPRRTVLKAADEIERLTARVAELERLSTRCGELRKANGEIAASLHGWKNGERHAYVAEQLPHIASALRRDANRYRNIREHLSVAEGQHNDIPPMWSFRHLPGRHWTFDAAIDAAIAKEAK